MILGFTCLEKAKLGPQTPGINYEQTSEGVQYVSGTSSVQDVSDWYCASSLVLHIVYTG